MPRLLNFLIILCLGLCLTQDLFAGTSIGVLFGSYGDIDDVDHELRMFLRNTLTDPDVLPMPGWLRATIADAGWYIQKAEILKQYAAIHGRTGTRDLSQEQADAVAEQLRVRGYQAKGYAGFTMTFPFVAQALEKAKQDGVEKLFVFYQGAQYSKDTAQILFRHVKDYLAKYPEWQVEVIGIKSFSDDPRFVELIAKRIQSRLMNEFADYRPSDVCLYLTMHGNVMRLAREGDPYLTQAMKVVEVLRKRFKGSPVTYGFHNHDEIPVVRWSQPSNHKALAAVAEHSCKAVLVNGLISFTVDNLETLYNQAIEAPAILISEAKKRGVPDKHVFVENMFNSDQDFVDYMADLATEANLGQGDIITLSSHSVF